MKEIHFKIPKGWRKGQTLFNFLWWLKREKGYPGEPEESGRMADPFNISDAKLDTLYKQFLLNL